MAIKILHITNHIGTLMNLQNVCKHIDNCEISNRPWEYYCYIDSNEADIIFETHKNEISGYDYLLFTDTSVYARPFLQNIEKHNCKIIVYITNRYDWGVWSHNDIKYYDLYMNQSHNPRVFFCADNRYDQYYASTRGVKFFYDDIIRLTPVIENTITLPSIKKFFIYNKASHINNYSKFLDENNIKYELFGEGFKSYKDKYELCEYIGTIHLPYQVNIQSFMENISYNIIYFVPSKKFFIELLQEPWYYWEEKCRSVPLEPSIELAEWYQPENMPLVEYFDSWEDLGVKAASYLNNDGDINYEKVLSKKNIIKDYVNKNFEANIPKWKNIIK